MTEELRASQRLLNPPEASSPRVRRVMLGNRGRDTKPELALRRELHQRGLRFWVDRPVPPARTRADVLFPRWKVAVFVDGCFWHGCPEHCRPARTNASYWASKIERNVARDRSNNEILAEAGWTVLRVWEHESVVAASQRVVDALTAAGKPALVRTGAASGDGRPTGRL